MSFHFIERTWSEFIDSYGGGDDFILSILKNNLVLIGMDRLRFFFERELPLVSKEVIHDREVQLNKLREKIDKLFFDDQSLAYLKVKEFINLKCRIFLMKSNIIPNSKKDLLHKMKEKYPKYHKALTSLTIKNAQDRYTKLEGGYYD